MCITHIDAYTYIHIYIHIYTHTRTHACARTHRTNHLLNNSRKEQGTIPVFFPIDDCKIKEMFIRSGDKNIPPLKEPKVHCCVYKKPATGQYPEAAEFNPHPQPYFCKIQLNIMPRLRLGLPNDFCSSIPPT
jgi:hypothetical protein